MAQVRELPLKEFDGPKPIENDDGGIVTMAGDMMPHEARHYALLVTAGAPRMTPTFPPQFNLGFLRDGRLRVLEPISVTWSKEDDQIIAEAAEINEYGYGDTIAEAIEDLQATIAELFLRLEKDRERLGADLLNVYRILTKKLRRVDANHRS